MSRRQRKQNRTSNSTSPRSKSGRKGLWWKSLLGISLLLIAGMIFAYNKAISFLHSESFRDKVSLEVGALIGSEVSFADFKWNGLSAKNDQLKSTGEGLISSIDAEKLQLDVDLDFFKRDKFTLKNVVINSVNAEIDLDKDFLTFELEKKEKGFIESLLPEKIELLDAVINDVNAKIHSKSGDYTMSGVRIEAEKAKDSDSYSAHISNGRLKLPYTLLDSVRLKQGDLILMDKEIYIKDTKFEIYESGELRLDGVVDLTPHARDMYDIEAELSGLKCEDIFPDAWHRHLEGEVVGSFRVKPHQGKEPLIVGKLEIKDGTLQALPVLNTVSIYLAEPKYRTLEFQKFSCDFEKFRDQTHLRNIVLESKGLIQVEGNLKIEGENLNGLFDIGIPSNYLENIPGAKNSVFQPGKDELLWAKVKIGGNFDDMTEDLSGRLMAAATEEMIKRTIEMGIQLADPETMKKFVDPKTLEQLLNGGKGGIKNVEGILKGDKDLLEGGVGAAKGLLEGITGNKPAEKEPENKGEKDDEKKEDDGGGIIPEIEKILPFSL